MRGRSRTRNRNRNRAMLLVMTLGVAFIAVACGRASEREINQALGITPTPTRSAEEIATATAEAVALAATRTAIAATAGSPGAAILGDVTQGRAQFTVRCQQCHRPDGAGRGPSLAGPSSPALALTDAQIETLIREGTTSTGASHLPPGPFTEIEISARQLANITAYLRSEAE